MYIRRKCTAHLTWPRLQVPEYDAGSYGKIVTADASVEGGSAAACSGNVRAAFELLFSLGEDPKGRAAIAKAMRLCSAGDLEGLEDVYVLAGWVQAAWDFMVCAANTCAFFLSSLMSLKDVLY